jgi:acetyltransferase-like isoleucine patch superfamily enzyme
MTTTPAGPLARPPAYPMALWRIGWTVGTVAAVEALVCGLAALPVLALWIRLAGVHVWGEPVRVALLAVSAVPGYALFALLLMLLSALALRSTGWRTPADTEMRIADLGWPLLDWVRSMIIAHVVRLFAGTIFRGTPIWTAYLRLAGVRAGRRVYVNSLAVSDYPLLELGDDVIIGDDAHLSGHTVENGLVKTGRVRIGRNVTVGLGAVIGIGVRVGDGCQIGALSLVPKYATLEPGDVYVGIPVHRLGRDSDATHP